jgi:hypothetical protein
MQPDATTNDQDPKTPRWVAPVYITLSAILFPWIFYLYHTLPRRELSSHYRAAWVGFDIILFGQLARTGFYALKERWRHLVRPHAASCATLLIVDAWFDITTSARSELPVSILEAAVVELPLAALCWWVALSGGFHRHPAAQGRLGAPAQETQGGPPPGP